MKNRIGFFTICLSLALVLGASQWALSGWVITMLPDNQCFTTYITCLGADCVLPIFLPCQVCNTPNVSTMGCPFDDPMSSATSSAGSCTGSPVFLATGEYFSAHTDLQTHAVGVPLRVYRNYLSGRRTAGLGGLGWSTPAEARLSDAVYMFSAPNTYSELVNIVLPNGFSVTFTKDTNGAFIPPVWLHDTLTKNQDQNGNILSWDYKVFRSRQKYHFASTGELFSITDRYNNTQSWTYVGGRLDRMTDNVSGHYIAFTYWLDGRVKTVTDDAGRQVIYTYDTATGELLTVEDPVNRVTTYEYITRHMGPLLWHIKDNWNRLITEVGYYENDRVSSYTQDGVTYTINQDGTQKVGVESDSTYDYSFLPNGLITSRSYTLRHGSDTVQGTENIDYTPDFSVMRVTNAAGIKTLYTYNSNNGTVKDVTRDEGGASAVKFVIGYDPTYPERVTSITPTDPVTGNVNTDWQAIQADYYTVGAPSALHDVYRVRDDGTGRDTLVTFGYDTNGRVTSIADGTGATTNLQYDASNEVHIATLPKNSDAGSSPVYQYGHDLVGRINTITDPLGHVTLLDYDKIDRLKKLTLPKPTPTFPNNFEWDYTYDIPNGPIVSTEEKDPNNQIDPGGRKRTVGFDEFGHLRSSVDEQNNVTSVNYSAGHLDTITNAAGGHRGHEFFGGELLQSVAERAPGEQIEQVVYTYDARKRLHSRTSPNGDTVTFEYDAFDRVKKRTFSSGVTNADITYDYVGQKLITVTDGLAGESHNFTYDHSYRLLTEDTLPERGQHITYDTYDLADRLTQYTVVGGPVTNYQYYADGSPKLVTWSRIPGSFTFTYRLDGVYDKIVMPNGQFRQFAFDDQQRLTQIANIHPTAGPGGSSLNLGTYSYGYDYDDVAALYWMMGQRTSMTATSAITGFPTGTTKYYYDRTYQLTQASYPNISPFSGEFDSWTYDGIGNRLTESVSGNLVSWDSYSGGSRLLLGVNPNTTFGYNNNGSVETRSNAVTGPNYQFGWNVRNRLSSITGDASAIYSYDFRARRFSKTVSGVNTSYIYAGQNVISQTTGGATSEFLFAPGIDKPLAAYIGGARYYYSVDGLGSVSLLTTPAGAVQDSYVYDAWGKIRSQTVNVAQPFIYTGRETGEAGLMYYRARYYSPDLGRFISEDPIRYGNISLYPYVGNDPISFIDPFGLWGGGVSVSESTEAGLGVVGAGQTGTAGTGVFMDGLSFSEVGSFLSWGGFAGLIDKAIKFPDCLGNPLKFAENDISSVDGAYAGGGVNGFFTNAENREDLGGPSKTLSLNAAWGLRAFSAQFSINGDGIWMLSVGLPNMGGGYGLDLSLYDTYTWAGKKDYPCGCRKQ